MEPTLQTSQPSRPAPLNQRTRALSCWAGGAGGYSGHEKKVLVLCFDGTGNKFKGNSGDTNILKIFSMLDRRKGNQVHYYQPGIGTYLTSNAMTHKTAKGMSARIKSAYHKAVDAAVGTSFDQHVMGGYKFLMRYYHAGDDIYMFGFSRGAYTARFLCEMLDHVGLVVQGNEEMVHFAWKTFSEWQMRQHADDPAGKRKKEEMYNYMKAFRETFARPVKRVRFLGLFDTVNSVPRFENAWLNRGSRFPYTARSTARVIRHAVGLDERRAKFRLDLVEKVDMNEISDSIERGARKAKTRSWGLERRRTVQDGIVKGPMRALTQRVGGLRRGSKLLAPADPALLRMHMKAGGQWGEPDAVTASLVSLNIHLDKEDGDDEDAEQDVDEVWFPGCHGDIGGGWDLAPGEPALSYGPLVWMVREARRAGLVFDERRLKELGCWAELDADEGDTPSPVADAANPAIAVSLPTPGAGSPPPGPATPLARPPSDLSSRHGVMTTTGPSQITVTNLAKTKNDMDYRTKTRLVAAYGSGKIHCCLTFGGGLAASGVIGWKLMEYLPFRRMDLQPDGSWKSIAWPLPRGEVRDVPEHAKIHCSVLVRMEMDEKYRPGNLLVGGGGRGVRVAPKDCGTGDWLVIREPGSLLGEVLVKKSSLRPKVATKA
ncbi:hypothetical protein DFH27DRAFT_479524 [Peziza echinospora]|nr:hypothetical protein DFH27DRAFT_479524 [Peziza echinospora]